jgi:serine/threonine-protein kinase
MSPEQVRNPQTVDPRSDIWSLGVILYELLTGVTPFAADNTLSVLAGVVADEPPPLRALREEVPIALEDVIQRCLEKRPSRRYATVVELAKALALHTPTGEAAIERILAIVRSADARSSASRQRHESDPVLLAEVQRSSTLAAPTSESDRPPPSYVATLESPRVPNRTSTSAVYGSGGWSGPRPLFPQRFRRIALAAGLGALIAVLFGTSVARWRSAGVSPQSARDGLHAVAFAGTPAEVSCAPSNAGTVTARMVAESPKPDSDDPALASSCTKPDIHSIAAREATSLRTVIVTVPPASHSTAAKDSPPKMTAPLGPPTVDSPADPLEGRE